MPLIEVYARWRDKDDKPQSMFVTSTSWPSDSIYRGDQLERWMVDAIRAAEQIERNNRPFPQTDTDGATEHAGRNAALESQQAGRDKG